MAGFEEQLNSILGNQEAMGQIMALARSLSGEQQPAGPAEAPENPEESMPDGATYIPTETSAPAPALSALLGQIDPAMLQTGMEIIRQVQGTEDRNTALLNALRPFLREERRARLDRAVQIARMSKLVRVALGTLRGKEGERV